MGECLPLPFPFGLKAFDNYVFLSLSFSHLFFPDHMWLVEEKMKNKQTCVYQCYNMKVTFCQIPFQMKAFFLFSFRALCVEKE